MKKKLIYIAVTGLFFATLTACSGTVENSNTSKNENSTQQSEASKVGETSEISTSSEGSAQESNTTNESSTVSEVSSDNGTITDGQSTLTVYVLEVSEGSMKGESIPGEEGSEEDIKTITIYNENINTEDISEGMVVTITYTDDLKANGEEYTVNADSFEAL